MYIVQLCHRSPDESLSVEISANSPVPGLCFIQTLGSSATMKKKMLYGMLTFYFFSSNYGNSRATSTTCRPRPARRSPETAPPHHFVPIPRLEKVTNFTFTLTVLPIMPTYTFDIGNFIFPALSSLRASVSAKIY